MRSTNAFLLLTVVAVLGASCADRSESTTIGPGLSPDPDLDRVAALATIAGCSAPAAHPPTSQEHVALAAIDYDRLPPDGGEHLPDWAKTGVHDSLIAPGLQTHNLEHGHIGLQYDASVDPSIVTVFESAAASQPTMIFVAPFEGFTGGAVVSLTAWGHRVDCGPSLVGADELLPLVTAFVAEHIDQAPESVPGEPNA